MILKSGSDLGKRVELWGFEPQTSCMPCTLQLSLGVAGRGPVWRSPAASVAGRGLMSPGVAPRWLPAWLPANSLAPLMFDDPYAFVPTSCCTSVLYSPGLELPPTILVTTLEGATRWQRSQIALCHSAPSSSAWQVALTVGVAGRCRNGARWPRRRLGGGGHRCGRSPGSRRGGHCAAPQAQA